MRKPIVAVLVILLAVPALAAEPKTEDQKTLYTVGFLMARQLSVFNLTPEELAVVKQGIDDGTAGKKPSVDLEVYKGNIQKLALDRLSAKSQQYLAKAAKEPGARKTASGLIYESEKEGTGARPTATSKVKVNYRGTLVDGREFDSSYASGKPAEFELDKVIKCWTEGLQMMKVGGKARLICPPQLAYGERSAGSIPPNSALIFEVELLEIVK